MLLLLLGVAQTCASAGLPRSAAAPSRLTEANPLLDTTVGCSSGSVQMLLLRAASAGSRSESCLCLTLRGRGSRDVVGPAVTMIDDAFAQAGPCTCVVRMAESRGASLLSLPIIARFMRQHQHQMPHIVILEARGLGLTAVRIVRRLSGSDRIRLFPSLTHFEAFARDAGGGARDLMALQCARAAQRRGRPSPFHVSWAETWQRVRDSFETLSNNMPRKAPVGAAGSAGR